MRIGRGYPQQSFTVAGQAFGPRIPTTLQVFAGPHVLLTKTRPRPTVPKVSPPTVVRVPQVEQAEQTIRVTLARTRPQPTRKFLGRPVALTVFAGPQVAVAKTKPRPTTTRLAPPTVVKTPSVEQREQTISVYLARTRPRPTRSVLPATIVAAAAFTAEPISVSLVRIRPRPTARVLGPPTALQVFTGPHVVRVRARPRATVKRLAPPTVVRIPSVEQAEQTIRTTLARMRPRPTVRLLGAPTALQTFAVGRVALARIRPRPTARTLGKPTVVRVPSIEQQEDTIRVALTHIRPRPTTRTLARPVTLQVFASGNPAFTVTRPRKTIWRLNPPTVVCVPAVEQQEDTIRVALTRIRPRPTTRIIVYPPATLAVAAASLKQTIALARTRPRPTVKKLGAPQTVLTPSVEQAPRIRTALARIRPRPTVKSLGPPTALRTFAAAEVTLARIRARKIVYALRPPTVLRVPQVEQAEDTIRIILTRARPRPTTVALRRPIAVNLFAARKVTAALVVTRPARTSSHLASPATLQVTARPLQVELAPGRRPAVQSRLAPPTVIAPAVPVSLTLTVWLVAVKARLLHRPVKHIQPQILPVVIPRPGWTDTRTSPAAAAAGTTVAPDAAEGGTAAVAGAEGRDSPDAATTIGTVKTDAAEISDKRSGT